MRFSPDTRELSGQARRAEAVEDPAAAAGTQETVRAVARQHLVPKLLVQRDLAGDHLLRQQPFDEVVVATVAVAAR